MATTIGVYADIFWQFDSCLKIAWDAYINKWHRGRYEGEDENHQETELYKKISEEINNMWVKKATYSFEDQIIAWSKQTERKYNNIKVSYNNANYSNHVRVEILAPNQETLDLALIFFRDEAKKSSFAIFARKAGYDIDNEINS